MQKVGKTTRKRRRLPNLETPEIANLLSAMETSFTSFHDAEEIYGIGSAESLQEWSEVLASRERYRLSIQARKMEVFEGFADEFEQLGVGEKLRVLKSMQTSKSKSAPLLKLDSDSLDSYRIHYASQFANTYAPREDIARILPKTMRDPIPILPTAQIFNESSVRQRIQWLAKGKAAGNSGIMSEVFQAAGEVIVPVLSLLYRTYSDWQIFPQPWKCSRIQPVPKKGDLTKISNYRPISLTEVSRKLYEGILLPHLVQVLEPLSVEQGGFRAKRGTLEQIAVLQEWIVQARFAKTQRLMAFLDIKAAYDSVDRSKLWDKCTNRGLSIDMVHILQGLFDDNSAFVAIAGRRSAPFHLEAGVLQGSLLSPLLYSVFIDDLVSALKVGVHDAVSIGCRPFQCLLYADDIVLMAERESTLRDMLRVCEIHSLGNRYRFNALKCEILSTLPLSMSVYSQEGEDCRRMPQVDSFTYLGCNVTVNGINWENHFSRLRTRALNITSFLASAGITGRGLGLEAALMAYRSLVRPVMEYGLCLVPKPEGLSLKFLTKYINWPCQSCQEPASARQRKLLGCFWRCRQ